MRRITIFTIALALTAGTAFAQTLPPQPPPVNGPLGGSTDAERAACHPDVVRFCKSLVKDDANADVFAILNCLQTNRQRISPACQTVLASHGQ
jgi:hypothetical protein